MRATCLRGRGSAQSAQWRYRSARGRRPGPTQLHQGAAGTGVCELGVARAQGDRHPALLTKDFWFGLLVAGNRGNFHSPMSPFGSVDSKCNDGDDEWHGRAQAGCTTLALHSCWAPQPPGTLAHALTEIPTAQCPKLVHSSLACQPCKVGWGVGLLSLTVASGGAPALLGGALRLLGRQGQC